jgi:hypothetical protein
MEAIVQLRHNRQQNEEIEKGKSEGNNGDSPKGWQWNKGEESQEKRITRTRIQS